MIVGPHSFAYLASFAGSGATLPVTSGLVARYKADGITGLSDGDSVNPWLDEQGNFDISGGSPTYKENIQNGLPIVRFSGEQLSNSSSVITGSQNRTIFVVVEADNTEDRGMLDFGTSSDGTAFKLTPEFGVRVNGGNRIFSEAASLSFEVLTIRLDGSNTTDLEAWRNGSALGVSGTGSRELNTGSRIFVGVGISGNPFWGDIAEILIYDSALSSSDRANVESYLMDKWGI